MDNDGFFPDDLSHLYPTYLSASALHVFTCPSGGHEIPSPDRIEQDGSFIYVHGLSESSHSSLVLAHDKSSNHGDAGRNELYVDGHVKWKPDR